MSIKTILIADKPTLDKVKTNTDDIKNTAQNSANILSGIKESTDKLSTVIGHSSDVPNMDMDTLFSKINSLLDVKGSVSVAKYGLKKPQELYRSSGGSYNYSAEILGNKLYIIYGYTSNGVYSNSIRIFNLDDNIQENTTLSGSLPKSSVTSHVVYNDKIYLFHRDQSVYTIDGTNINNAGFSIPSSNYVYNSFVYDDHIYIGVARDSDSTLVVYKLNGTSLENTSMKLSSRFNNGKSIVFNGFVYFVDSSSSNSIKKYNLSTGKEEKSLPINGCEAYFVLNGLIYIFPSTNLSEAGYKTIDVNDNVSSYTYNNSISISGTVQNFVYKNRFILFIGYGSSSNGYCAINEIGYVMNCVIPKSCKLYTDHNLYPEVYKDEDGTYVMSETTTISIGDLDHDNINMTISK